MRIVIRSSSLLFSVLGIILDAPVTKVRKKQAESEEQDPQPGAPHGTAPEQPRTEG
jgi:hypothetical protein